jgi:Protein of unknown function (DUF3072)
MPNESIELMTHEQAALLKSLSEAAREPEAFAENLSRAAAAQRITVLRTKLAKDSGGAQHKPG